MSTSLILLKRVCPFCSRSTRFSSNQKLREHIAKTHNNVLPSRTFKQQNRSNTKNYTESLHKEHPTATIKFTCPSCLNHYRTKPTLKTHMEEHIASFFELTTHPADIWIIGDNNISELFGKYKAHCLQEKVEYKSLDSHLKELLAMSSIVLLQRRNDYGEIINNYISAGALDNAYTNEKSKLHFEKRMNSSLTESITNILKDLQENKIRNTAARMKLLNLVEDAAGFEKNVILAVESILPSIKDLEIEQRQESYLTASFIHPLIQALFSLEFANRVGYCSNTIVTEIEDTNKRPDYVVDVYEHYRYSYTSCYGEVKNDNSSNLDYIMDFYRLCLFAKGGIEGQNLDKVIFFQAIGLKVSFYVMICPCSNIRSVIELATITIPAVQKDLLNFMSILDTLLSVTALHHSIKPNPDLNMVTSSPTLPFEFLHTKATLPRKRKSCLNTLS